MSVVRIYNPVSLNPRKKKPWTYQQAAARKDQAERFVRDVVEDDDRADEIAAMSVEEYATTRGKEINPNRRRNTVKRKVGTEQQGSNIKPTVLLAREDKLRKENDELKRKVESFKDKLDEIADVASASPNDSEEEDELKEKLNTILDLAAPDSVYDEDDDDENE